MISGVHTDAISTFVDDGQLALGSKADVDEQFGVRFAADDVWFHLEGDARTPIPPTHPFIGTVGSDAWIAEEVNPGPGRLWPGFSTEVEPADAVTGDTTFTLTGLQGPGELEVYAQGGLGTVERLWSSRGTTFRSFSLPRVHRHANWAFTAAGVYRLTVEATAVVQGQSQTARATYTFVVGDVAPAETTTTRLTVDADPVVATRPTTLSATVTPASVVGAVEFRDGETVLGHAPVADGRASLSTTLPRLGSRTLTARFVPTVANHFAASTSDPVEVTVQEDDDAEPLGIAGIERTYQPGEIIDLRLTGVTLEPGQTTLWRLYRKNQGSYLALSYGNTTMSHQLEATQALDGAEILVDILPPGAIAPLLSIQNTGRQKFKIGGSGGGSGEPVAIRGLANEAYRGDPIQVDVEHRELADDESGRWVRRQIGRYGQYQWVATTTDVVGSGPYRISTGSTGFGGWEYAYQLRDAEGSVLGQSPAVQPTLRTRELSISGLLGVYREGQSIRARANLYPERDDVEYQWGPANVVAGTPFAGRVAADEELVLPTTLAMNGRSLSATAYDATTGEEISSASSPLRVIEADGERVLLMGDLNSHGDHSHSFDRIFLRAYPEPVAADDDRFQWFWILPGDTDWVPIPGFTSASEELMGEPGLDGTQVMVRHYDAEGEPLASSEPARIAIFDHGLSGFHHVTIHGADPSYGAGERVSLSARVTVPNPLITRPTVLETYQWFVKRPGDAEPRPIEGATTADYTFGIEREWDGAELTSAVVHADGRIVYGPSDPVTLAVDRRAPHAPATPSVTHDGTTVTVTWDEPHDGGATVTGYDVILTAADGSRLTRSVGPDARSASFTDVPPGEWSAVVRATNELGVGPDSAASTPANLQAPGPPPEPQPEPRPDPGTPPAPTPVPTPVPETPAGPTATTLTATRATQTYGRTARLAVTVSPGATGTVSVRIPGRKQPVTGRVSNGRATLTLPRRALKPGTRTLTVRYAGVPGRFAASSARATVRVAKAKPRIRIQRVGSNGFRVRVTGSGVKPTGRVTVTVDGRRRTARLGAQGRTTVRLAATRSTRTRTTVSVSYAGDRYVARGTARATVTARR